MVDRNVLSSQATTGQKLSRETGHAHIVNVDTAFIGLDDLIGQADNLQGRWLLHVKNSYLGLVASRAGETQENLGNGRGHFKLRNRSGGRLFAVIGKVSRNGHLANVFLATGLVVAFSMLYGPAAGESHHAILSLEARLVAIRRAHIWTRTDVPTMNLTAGPQGQSAFAPNATVTCDYVDKKMKGRSPKFTCKLAKDDEVKVKYGKENGEVYAEVAGTRLLWALGFHADRMYPVRVVCRGCPADPAENSKSKSGDVTFDPAAIEREEEGQILETNQGSGWAWPELDLVEETAGGAPRAQRDALKLLAVFLQHSDSKPEQQRLMCRPGEYLADNGEACLHTVMMINDIGLTFGHATRYNRNSVSSVNFEQWARAKVWSDPKQCIGDLSRSQTGTLDHPRISEAGRKFLADLLVQLTDAQLHDLFQVARFPDRTGGGRPATADEWVSAFKQKRDQIVNTTCPE